MTTYSPEERRRIFEAAHVALESAQASLDAPRPEAVEPPVEDRVARWRREADEQAARFARERAAPQQLTEWEVAQLQRDTLSAMVEQQKDFFLRLLAEVVAEVRAEFDQQVAALKQKVAALEEELGQVRGAKVVEAWPRKTA